MRSVVSDIAVSDTAVSESTAAGPLKYHVCQVRATLMRALYIVLFSTPMVFGSMFALAVFFVSCLLIGCIQYCCPPLLHSFAALAALLCRPSHASYSNSAACCTQVRGYVFLEISTLVYEVAAMTALLELVVIREGGDQALIRFAASRSGQSSTALAISSFVSVVAEMLVDAAARLE